MFQCMNGRRIRDQGKNASLDSCNLASNQIMTILACGWMIDGPAQAKPQAHSKVYLFDASIAFTLGGKHSG